MDLLQIYCIKECAEWILANKFKQVGLEFPDGQQHSHSVSQLLKKEIGFNPIVLQDSNRSCGKCCVDERSSKPRGIEAVIHFGNSCLTPTISLPVLFVLNSLLPFESNKLIELIVSSSDAPKEDEDVILLYDLCFTPFISSFYSTLKTHFSNLILSKLVIPEKAELIFYNEFKNLNVDELNINETNEKTLLINNRKFILPENKELKDYNFIYICGENPSMMSCHMRFSDKIFYLVDVAKLSFTRCNFIKTVMGRSKKIEQVREAKSIGILMTLIHNHREISNRMKQLIKSSNKKCYLFVLGPITEAKLGNIVCADIFVYISCPENSLFDRNNDNYLYKKLVTPWELEVALNPLYEWSLNFETNFNELLTVDIEEESEKETKETIPNEINHTEEREKSDTEIIERKPGTLYKLHENGAGQVLQSLSWKGLNPSEESSVPIGTVVEGRSGIAMQYDSEIKYNL
ncbi:UNVERIFIED_CONTAM: hypothetical protein RMT77_012921 [Armadillidium vulgare]